MSNLTITTLPDLQRTLNHIADTGCPCLSCHLERMAEEYDDEQLQLCAEHLRGVIDVCNIVHATDEEALEDIEALAHSEGYPVLAESMDAFIQFIGKIRDLAPRLAEERADHAALVNENQPTE